MYDGALFKNKNTLMRPFHQNILLAITFKILFDVISINHICIINITGEAKSYIFAF